MTAQEYILSALNSLAEPVVPEDIGNTPVEEAIYAKVMSKKFRKLRADDEIIAITKKAIAMSVAENKPIVVNFVFGGNKLWRFEEAPEIDWAELFATIYFLQWMKTVASVYKPGAYVEYYSEDLVLEGMNNLPKQETDQYSETFRKMLIWLKPYIPKGVSVGYRRYEEDYDDISQYFVELEETKAVVLKELGDKLPVLTEPQRIATEMNVRLKPGQADDPLWREKVELIHQSIERTPTIEKYFYDPSMIPACPTYYPACLTTGSTKKSLAKFWVAVGVLERKGDTYSEVVLTPNQLEGARYQWEDVTIDGLTGKNFARIRIVEPQ